MAYNALIRQYITRNRMEQLVNIIQNLKEKCKCKQMVFQEEKGVEQETIIQLAAKHNLLTHFDEVLNDVFVDNRNSSGKTALHVAAELGNRKSIDVLLNRKARLDAVDNDGNTTFHSAAKSGKLSSLLGQTMAEICKPKEITVSEWDNILTTIVKELLNKKYKEEFHRKMLRSSVTKKLINQRNHNGDSTLDLAANFGDVESVVYLLEAEVSVIASVLIKIILQSLECQDDQVKLDSLKKIYKAIVYHTRKSSEAKNYTQQIIIDSDNSMAMMFPANQEMKDLLECKIQHAFEEEKYAGGKKVDSATKMKILGIHYNMRHLNILQFACAKGADEMVMEILSTPGVYMFNSEHFPNIIYDVTNFSPETMTTMDDNRLNVRVNTKVRPDQIEGVNSTRKRNETDTCKNGEDESETQGGSSHATSVPDVKNQEESNEKEYTLNINTMTRVDDGRSCLEIITYYSKSNQYRSWNLLQISPFKELADKYWKVERIVYVLLVFHVIFMACFTKLQFADKRFLDQTIQN